jgi:hypothetical protein
MRLFYRNERDAAIRRAYGRTRTSSWVRLKRLAGFGVERGEWATLSPKLKIRQSANRIARRWIWPAFPERFERKFSGLGWIWHGNAGSFCL